MMTDEREVGHEENPHLMTPGASDGLNLSHIKYALRWSSLALSVFDGGRSVDHLCNDEITKSSLAFLVRRSRIRPWKWGMKISPWFSDRDMVPCVRCTQAVEGLCAVPICVFPLIDTGTIV